MRKIPAIYHSKGKKLKQKIDEISLLKYVKFEESLKKDNKRISPFLTPSLTQEYNPLIKESDYLIKKIKAFKNKETEKDFKEIFSEIQAFIAKLKSILKSKDSKATNHKAGIDEGKTANNDDEKDSDPAAFGFTERPKPGKSETKEDYYRVIGTEEEFYKEFQHAKGEFEHFPNLNAKSFLRDRGVLLSNDLLQNQSVRTIMDSYDKYLEAHDVKEAQALFEIIKRRVNPDSKREPDNPEDGLIINDNLGH